MSVVYKPFKIVAPERCLKIVGAAVDVNAALEITILSWANDYDLEVVFEHEEYEEVD